jgi:hypothetical protein
VLGQEDSRRRNAALLCLPTDSRFIPRVGTDQDEVRAPAWMAGLA